MEKQFIVEKLKYNIQEYHKNGTLGKTVILIQLSYYQKNGILTEEEYNRFINFLDKKEELLSSG